MRAPERAARHAGAGSTKRRPDGIRRYSIVSVSGSAQSRGTTSRWWPTVRVGDQGERASDGRLRTAQAEHAPSPHPRNSFSLDELAAQIEYALTALRSHAEAGPAAHIADIAGMDRGTAVTYVSSLIGW